MPRIFRGRSPGTDEIFGDVKNECVDLFKVKVDNIDDEILLPYDVHKNHHMTSIITI